MINLRTLHSSAHSSARAIAVAALLVPLASCATPPEDPDELAAYREANDPIEDINREIFDFNLWIDRNAMKPAASAYADVVPAGVRRSTTNFFNNLGTPVILVNDILQGESGRAAETLMRFMVNSLVGFGGFFDVAGDWGLARHEEDFGQTLAVWGAPEGPYLMLPLLGPSNVRDTVGMGVDTVTNPLFWVGTFIEPEALTYYDYASTPVDALNQRSAVLDTLDEVQRTSIDFYAAIRSLYRQRRDTLIRNELLGTDVPTSSMISEAPSTLPYAEPMSALSELPSER